MRGKRSIALGTFIGGILGTTAAILTAPKSGEALREDIRSLVDQGKSKMMGS